MHHDSSDVSVNPYIAFTDVFINVALVFALLAPLVLLLGNKGWEETRYKEFQQDLQTQVATMPAEARPTMAPRNDAPGEQRWVFSSAALFETGSTELAAGGKRALRDFAALLERNDKLWWRLRVEAHSRQMTPRPSVAEERAAMRLTAERAVEVAMFLYGSCSIEPYRVVPSGRGHQDLARPNNPASADNDRVDLLVLPRTVGATESGRRKSLRQPP